MTNWGTPSSQKKYFQKSRIRQPLLAKKIFLQNTTSGHLNHEIILSFTIFDCWKVLKGPVFESQISQITDLLVCVSSL